MYLFFAIPIGVWIYYTYFWDAATILISMDEAPRFMQYNFWREAPINFLLFYSVFSFTLNVIPWWVALIYLFALSGFYSSRGNKKAIKLFRKKLIEKISTNSSPEQIKRIAAIINLSDDEIVDNAAAVSIWNNFESEVY